MSWHDLALMARGGTLALLCLWSWLLWRDHRGQLAGRLAIAMNIGIACYMAITVSPGSGASAIGFLLAVGGGATPALFWLFARTWFNDRTSLARGDSIVAAAAIANVVILQLAWAFWPPGIIPSGIIFRLSEIAFGLGGLWEAWRGREGDLVEGRRRMRFAVVAAVGGYVLAIGLAEMAVFNARAPHLLLDVIGASIVLIVLGFCAALFAMRQRDLFEAAVTQAGERAPAIAAEDPLAARLAAIMETERAYRDERLTIAALAARMGEQEYRLRRLINQSLGYRNFAQFLGSYRLAEIKSALADPQQREVPILTIALDAGYGSLGPFNRAFREAEGMTPSEYRARRAG